MFHIEKNQPVYPTDPAANTKSFKRCTEVHPPEDNLSISVTQIRKKATTPVWAKDAHTKNLNQLNKKGAEKLLFHLADSLKYTSTAQMPQGKIWDHNGLKGRL